MRPDYLLLANYSLWMVRVAWHSLITIRRGTRLRSHCAPLRWKLCLRDSRTASTAQSMAASLSSPDQQGTRGRDGNADGGGTDLAGGEDPQPSARHVIPDGLELQAARHINTAAAQA